MLNNLRVNVSVERAPTGSRCVVCGRGGSVWATPDGFCHLRCDPPARAIRRVADGIAGAMADDSDAQRWVRELRRIATLLAQVDPK